MCFLVEFHDKDVTKNGWKYKHTRSRLHIHNISRAHTQTNTNGTILRVHVPRIRFSLLICSTYDNSGIVLGHGHSDREMQCTQRRNQVNSVQSTTIEARYRSVNAQRITVSIKFSFICSMYRGHDMYLNCMLDVVYTHDFYHVQVISTHKAHTVSAFVLFRPSIDKLRFHCMRWLH